MDAVVLVWLLHLLDDAEPVIGEAARVLGPGGVLVTTVDRDAGHDGSDVAALTEPLRRRFAPGASDGYERVRLLAAEQGLRPGGETDFRGVGQGRDPRKWQEAIRAGRVRWTKGVRPEVVAELCRDIAALPEQDVARPDPRYRLVAFRA